MASRPAPSPDRLFDRRFYSRSHLGPSALNTNDHTYAVSPDGQRILAPRPAGRRHAQAAHQAFSARV
jgi:hypothetical protein